MSAILSWLWAGGVWSVLGLLVLAALDSSLIFFLPLAVDVLLIYVVAASDRAAWLYPLVATTGSLAGAAFTYWVAHRGGERGMARFVSTARLQQVRDRFQGRSAVALALPALIPPPFPFTAYIVTAGVLGARPGRFFSTLVVVRGLRFGLEGVLATHYGRGLVGVFRSGGFRAAIVGIIVVAVAGTGYSLYRMIVHRGESRRA